MRIEDLDITQQSVDDFFDEIDTDALVESLKLSLWDIVDMQTKIYGSYDTLAPDWSSIL